MFHFHVVRVGFEWGSNPCEGWRTLLQTASISRPTFVKWNSRLSFDWSTFFRGNNTEIILMFLTSWHSLKEWIPNQFWSPSSLVVRGWGWGACYSAPTTSHKTTSQSVTGGGFSRPVSQLSHQLWREWQHSCLFDKTALTTTACQSNSQVRSQQSSS